jgi:hypothetical protein
LYYEIIPVAAIQWSSMADPIFEAAEQRPAFIPPKIFHKNGLS